MLDFYSAVQLIRFFFKYWWCNNYVNFDTKVSISFFKIVRKNKMRKHNYVNVLYNFLFDETKQR